MTVNLSVSVGATDDNLLIKKVFMAWLMIGHELFGTNTAGNQPCRWASGDIGNPPPDRGVVWPVEPGCDLTDGQTLGPHCPILFEQAIGPARQAAALATGRALPFGGSQLNLHQAAVLCVFDALPANAETAPDRPSA